MKLSSVLTLRPQPQVLCYFLQDITNGPFSICLNITIRALCEVKHKACSQDANKAQGECEYTFTL